MKKSVNHYAKDISDYRLSAAEIKNLAKIRPQVSPDEPKYVPSFVAQCSFDTEGDVTKFHSDLYLLMHQKNITDKIGIDNIKEYLKQINANYATSDTSMSNLTDEQLMEMCKDRRFNTITDNFQFQRMIANDYMSIRDEAIARIERKKAFEAERQKLIDSFNVNTTTSNPVSHV